MRRRRLSCRVFVSYSAPASAPRGSILLRQWRGTRALGPAQVGCCAYGGPAIEGLGGGGLGGRRCTLG